MQAWGEQQSWFGKHQHYIIQMNHNQLQTGSFSSDEEEEQPLFVPSSDLLSQYNREYSMIVNQVEKFLKQSIQRFVAFHNFGVSLNLNQLLGTLLNVQNSFKTRLAVKGTKDKDAKAIAKDTYETSFNRLIAKMTDIFQDLIDCQMQFKKAYFGVKPQQQVHRGQQRTRIMHNPIAYSVSSMTKSSKSQKMKLQDYIDREEKQEKREAELRATLNEKLKPKTTVVEKECKEEYSTTENLYRLNQKVDQFISDIKATRSRQQKLIELFNLNRIKNIHAQDITQCPTSTQVSVVSKAEDEREQQMDSFLENWRKIRKSSDSYTQQGVEGGKHLFKKRQNVNIERK